MLIGSHRRHNSGIQTSFSCNIYYYNAAGQDKAVQRIRQPCVMSRFITTCPNNFNVVLYVLFSLFLPTGHMPLSTLTRTYPLSCILKTFDTTLAAPDNRSHHLNPAPSGTP